MRYAETDKMGVAYHANYFIWFEVARCDLLRACGETYRNLETEGIYLPVVEAHCRYVLPARYDDRLTIETQAILKSQVRIEFRYKLDVISKSQFLKESIIIQRMFSCLI